MVRPTRALTALALSCLAAALLAGCPKDEFATETWTDKLDETNPAEVGKAIEMLERLKDPAAIKPLGATWKKRNKWSRALRAIIVIAGARDEKTGKGPHWDDAVPFLEEAVKDYDPSDKRSVEDAVVACAALGEAANPDSVGVLIDAANGPTAKALPKLSAGQNVRIAALKALGGFGGNERAVDTLIAVLQLVDPKVQVIHLNAAAANALAQTQNPKALQPLLRALFEASPIYHQVRGAVTRIGKPAIPELIKIFEGKHAAIEKFAQDSGFATDCDKATGPGTRCQAPGNLQFKAANLLGDLRAKEAVPLLNAALRQPSAVSFFDPGSGAPGPSSHSAVLDALRKIGDPSSAAVVLAYAKDPATDDTVRPIAIDVYSTLATDASGMDYLAGEMNNADADAEDIRRAAQMAYARLVRSQAEIAPLQKLLDLNARKAIEADQRASRASKPTEKDEASGQAADYRDFVLLFEQHKTRALIGVKCKQDAACYAGFLEKSADDVIKDLGIEIDPKARKAAKDAFRVAALERSLIELAKLGPKAEAGLPSLLKQVEVTDRIVRDGVLLALPRVAEHPCDACATRLDQVVESQRSQTTLDYLTADTRIVLNYFLANGAKVEAAPAKAGKPAAAEPAK